MRSNGFHPLPRGWQWKQFGECARLINGRAYSQNELLDSGTPVLRIQNLNGGDRWYYSDLSLPEEKYCESGDLLFAWSASFGPYRFSGPRSIFHYHIWRVLPNDILDKAFAYHLLDWITERVKAAAHGLAMLHMTKTGMEAWPVPLPPLSEQQRIAAILDKADALLAKRNAALATRRALTESLLSKLLGEAERRRWPVKRLADVCERIFDVDHKMPDEVPEGLPFISARDLTDGGISFANAKRISADDFRNLARKGQPRRGDVIFSRYGTIGKACMVGGDMEFLASYSCCTIRPNQAVVHPSFLSSYLSSPRVLRQAARETRGIAIPDLGLKQIKEFSIIVPSFDAQITFANVLQQLASCFSAMGHSLIQVHSMIACLQSKAFRGEL